MRRVMCVLSLDDPPPGSVRELLTGEVGMRRDGREAIERRLLDSFDWRVWNAGAVLVHDIDRGTGWLEWRRRADDAGQAVILGRQRTSAMPPTDAELPEGPVARLLVPVLEMRALLPRAVMTIERERFGLRDGEDKTVARASIEHVAVAGSADRADADLGWRLLVTGVRGYDDVLARVIARLVDAPGVAALTDDADLVAFEAAGARPGDYSSKVRVPLEPEMPALEAFTSVCRPLLGVIEANEHGVREDIDSEFLHDFRVAIRRTRSMLSQAPGVLPDAVRAFYSEEFKWLAGETSESRDLDVYLLEFDELVHHLADQQRVDLAPLRTLLVQLQREAHARLVDAVGSPRYDELVDSWRAFLDAPASGRDASTPVGRAAGQRIWKAYRSVVKHGRRIDDDSPAEVLHDLRKRAKKLRYLLEAYRSLYPRADMKSLENVLKALQDNLGTFQDCDVQISRLRQFAELLDERPSATGPTVLAMGLLTSQIAQRQHRARGEFHDRFVRFDRRRNRRRFRQLFAPVTEKVS